MTRPHTLAILACSTLLLPACRADYAYDKGAADTGSMSWDSEDEYQEEEEEDPVDTAEEDTGESCDDETPVTLYISPDDSNSMSSAAMVRDAVLDGWTSLNSIYVRTWEFMNYYRFDYDRPDEGLAVDAALVPDPNGEAGVYMMQIGVSSPAAAVAERDPMNIVFSLDTSGSMGGQPISLLRDSCRAIASRLKEGDTVSMVIWDTSQQILLENHAVTGPDDTVLMEIIGRLDSNGGTNLEQGLVTAYELADANYAPGRINRVVLISDGGANAGVTDKELIARHADREDGEGIYLMGIGVGTASSYHDDLMDTVTDEGKGAAIFIGSTDEAEAILADRFLEVMDVAARDVHVKLDLPPGFEITRFSGEEYSSDPREVEPQHLAPNDTMVFQKHLSSCAPDLLEDDPEVTVTVRWDDATSFEQHTTTASFTWSELLEADRSLFWKGEAIFDYADALKARRKHGANTAEYRQAYELWQTAQAEAEALNPEDADLAEVQQVMELLAP